MTIPNSRPKKKNAEWWESYFDSRYLKEYESILSLERDRREVARLVEVLGLPVGSRILDVPCGQGRHAHLLAEAGFTVDGVDYSADLLEVARKRGRSKTLRYHQTDMRTLPSKWSSRFDAVLNLFTSFGFFSDPRDDERVIAEFARVLRSGGAFIWHGASRDGVMAKFVGKDWWESADGTLILHRRSFDPISGILDVESRHRSRAGHDNSRAHRIRLYTSTRIAELCAAHGMTVVEAYSGFSARPLTRRASEMMLVARKD